MAFVVMILMLVFISRFSLAAGYYPKHWMLPFALVSGLSVFFLAGFTPSQALFYGVAAAGALWMWLMLLEKLDGTFMLWWSVLIVGLLMPFWLLFLVPHF